MFDIKAYSFILCFLDFNPEDYNLQRVPVEIFENSGARKDNRFKYIEVRTFFHVLYFR